MWNVSGTYKTPTRRRGTHSGGTSAQSHGRPPSARTDAARHREDIRPRRPAALHARHVAYRRSTATSPTALQWTAPRDRPRRQNAGPRVQRKARVKPAYVLPAPSATHFFDRAEDLITDDTPSASGQTEPAPVAAGDAQLQPAVIATPRAPPTTTPGPPHHRRTGRPHHSRQRTTSRAPAAAFDSNGRAASPVRHDTQTGNHAPEPPNAVRIRRPRAAVRCRDPTSSCKCLRSVTPVEPRTPSPAFVPAPGPAFACFASAASGVEAGSAPAPAYRIRFSVELRTSRTTPPGLSVVSPAPAFEFRRQRTRASAFETSPPMTCNARLHAHRY
ncbi:extensin-like [Schistocerca americana]|uniref:extensin-like n=1 Tax=Schistocerca americana TaxID=7009 RepID=UPI001F4F7DFE|nr:extensin-like [Schistocerca americana]